MIHLGTDPCDPLSVPDITVDSDGDGVTDLEEINRFVTNPIAADSVDDGADDFGGTRMMLARPEAWAGTLRGCWRVVWLCRGFGGHMAGRRRLKMSISGSVVLWGVPKLEAAL